MTVIAGVVDAGRVLLGGDSAGVAGYAMTVRSDQKVFVNGAYVFGFCGSFRIGQLLNHAFVPPAPPPDPAALDRFMATTWIDAARNCLQEGGAAFNASGVEYGGTFLVGVHGRLLEVDCDYQVGEPADGYAAVGCGGDIARGALHATIGVQMTAENRIATALMAAERHSAGVRGPFTMLWEPPR